MIRTLQQDQWRACNNLCQNWEYPGKIDTGLGSSDTVIYCYITNFPSGIWSLWLNAYIHLTISRLRLIIWASVLLNVDSEWCFDNLRGSHLFFGVKVSCITSVETLVIGQIGQLSPNVIGHLSLKLWCYWLWRFWRWLVLFDLSFVTAGWSLIVS